MSRCTNLVLYKGNWYHPNFFRRGPACIKRAKYTCQDCGKRRGEEYITKSGRTEKVVIQAHHPNNDPANSRAELIALCKSCHLKADGKLHARTRKRKAREALIRAGQCFLPGFGARRRRKTLA